MDDSFHSGVSEWDELEARSLISAAQNGAQDTLPKKTKSKQYLRKQILVICLLALCAVVSLFKEDLMALMIFEAEVEIIGKIPVEELRTLVLEGKKDFDELVQKEYGEYAGQVFDTVSVLRSFKTINDIANEKEKSNKDKSRERLKRRMKIKIIESQISEGITTFTWAVGGHSASAGHGNLFKQAYGSIIEQSLQDIFGSLGIKFRVKNYAMGGTKSAPEMAMCMESVYGTDIDIISWDFGMIDGRAQSLYDLWTQRAGVHPTRPILFSFGQRYFQNVHGGIENAGGAGFEQNFVNAKMIFPNSDDLLVDKSKFPPAIVDYMCSGHAEAGEPCTEQKWNTSYACGKNMRAQVSWHPGWKDHLFTGRVTAAFILETFLQAIDELSQGIGSGSGEENSTSTNGATMQEALEDPNGVLPPTQPAISSRYLDELHMFEKKDRRAFFESTPPTVIFEGGLTHHGNFTSFQRSKGFCRTSLLPNEARYNGLVTGKYQPSNYLYAGKTDYEDEGFDMKTLPDPEPDNNSTELMLVYNTKGSRSACSEANIDFKDLYYVREEDHWVTTTIPNDAEKIYFNVGDNIDGVIMLCTLVGEFGQFPADYVKISEFYNGTENAGIIVNGIQVSDGINVHEERCYVLKHGEGEDGYFFPPDSDGRFQIQMRLPRKGNLYITSMVIL